jgi:hypothetical protein
VTKEGKVAVEVEAAVPLKFELKKIDCERIAKNKFVEIPGETLRRFSGQLFSFINAHVDQVNIDAGDGVEVKLTWPCLVLCHEFVAAITQTAQARSILPKKPAMDNLAHVDAIAVSCQVAELAQGIGRASGREPMSSFPRNLPT